MKIRRKSREIARLKYLLDTGIELQIGGESILGPMTLENLALIIKFGGYEDRADMFGDDLCHPDQARVAFLVSHPPQP